MSSKGICGPQKGQIEQFRCRIDNELIRVPYFSRSVDCVSDTGVFFGNDRFFLPSFGRGRLAFFYNPPLATGGVEHQHNRGSPLIKMHPTELSSANSSAKENENCRTSRRRTKNIFPRDLGDWIQVSRQFQSNSRNYSSVFKNVKLFDNEIMNFSV